MEPNSTHTPTTAIASLNGLVREKKIVKHAHLFKPPNFKGTVKVEEFVTCSCPAALSCAATSAGHLS